MTHPLQGSSASVPVVLVTGATGFLGSTLVVELLRRRPDVEVLCLVRGTGTTSALDRLRSRRARAGASRRELAQVTAGTTIAEQMQQDVR